MPLQALFGRLKDYGSSELKLLLEGDSIDFLIDRPHAGFNCVPIVEEMVCLRTCIVSDFPCPAGSIRLSILRIWRTCHSFFCRTTSF
jgi:hypothetical protein